MAVIAGRTQRDQGCVYWPVLARARREGHLDRERRALLAGEIIARDPDDDMVLPKLGETELEPATPGPPEQCSFEPPTLNSD